MTDLSRFTTKESLFDFLQTNKKLLIAEKKATIKQADAINGFMSLVKDDKVYSSKAFVEVSEMPELEILQAKLAINATRIFDSHGDVHIDGLWDKSVNETKYILHLESHKMDFDHIISDEVIAGTEKIKWSDLNQPYPGTTEVLVFNSKIREDRNEDMFHNYIKGYVKQHSVGMRYVTVILCINSEEKRYADEKKAWDKYYPVIVNKEDVDEQGYFWAVTEAKFIEGSAVVLGSNKATPTLQISAIEPSDDTQTSNKNEDSRQDDTISQELFKKLLFN